jgi:hypothetical protein
VGFFSQAPSRFIEDLLVFSECEMLCEVGFEGCEFMAVDGESMVVKGVR